MIFPALRRFLADFLRVLAADLFSDAPVLPAAVAAPTVQIKKGCSMTFKQFVQP
jgi:hypothetical protein